MMIPDAGDVLILVLETLPLRHVDMLRTVVYLEHRPACWIYAGLCRIWTGASYPEIAQAAGLRSHTQALRWANNYAAAATLTGRLPSADFSLNIDVGRVFVQQAYAVNDEIGRRPWRKNPDAGGFDSSASPLARFAACGRGTDR